MARHAATRGHTVYQEQLDALIAFASSDRFKDELLKAKAEYFAGTGEVFEDDRSFEMRMASFLDYHVFDRVLPEHSKTPAQVFLLESGEIPQEALAVRRGLVETRHSLWEVRKLSKDLVRLRGLFDGKDVDVFERRQPTGLKKGDLIEARLIPVGGRYLFSSAFCFHPPEAKKPIAKELKRRRKEEPGFSTRDFIWAASKMRLKWERYRNIAVTDIYAFDRKTI
ncbi:MAG: hypothetical protein HY901_00735 [Deltaproteobacteria bacterium]|nr:hypothetical protein [Deltaproteobacteria bacterium]